MLAFHCTAVSTLLSPAVTAGCGCPDANPSVLPGDQCPQQQPGGKDCITHGLLLPGPTVRGFQTGATVIGQRHLHRSGGSHRPQVCKHWKSVPGLSKVIQFTFFLALTENGLQRQGAEVGREDPNVGVQAAVTEEIGKVERLGLCFGGNIGRPCCWAACGGERKREARQD